MEMCDSRHEPKFQITYISAKGNHRNPVWLVCEMCMGKKCFGSKEEILTMDVLA